MQKEEHVIVLDGHVVVLDGHVAVYDWHAIALHYDWFLTGMR